MVKHELVQFFATFTWAAAITGALLLVWAVR